jgi:tRNA uridine 5-carbamoylmethylation protein Kti12
MSIKPNKLLIIRGLPGSGKSTLAMRLIDTIPNSVHFEADNFKGLYNRDGFINLDLLPEAHDWCYEQTKEALKNNFDVIVSNTFTTNKEMERYVSLPYNAFIYECKGNYKNIHNVPDDVMKKMADRWEDVSIKTFLLMAI